MWALFDIMWAPFWHHLGILSTSFKSFNNIWCIHYSVISVILKIFDWPFWSPHFLAMWILCGNRTECMKMHSKIKIKLQVHRNAWASFTSFWYHLHHLASFTHHSCIVSTSSWVLVSIICILFGIIWALFGHHLHNFGIL